MDHSLYTKRRLEIFFSGQTLVYGAWLLLPFPSMEITTFASVTKFLSEPRWGWLFFFNGLSHLLTRILNGRRWWSPLIRWFASMTSMLLYASLSFLIAEVNWHSTAVIQYAILSAGAAMCLYSAWKDAQLAMRLRLVTNYA